MWLVLTTGSSVRPPPPNLCCLAHQVCSGRKGATESTQSTSLSELIGAEPWPLAISFLGALGNSLQLSVPTFVT